MSWTPLNLAADEYVKPSTPPALCGLIYTGARHVISGPPETAKTLFAFVVALEHLRAGGVAAVIDFEMGPRATRTLLGDVGATHDEIQAVYYVEPDSPPDEQDIQAMLDAGVTLVIIDAAAGAYDASELDDNDRKDVEKFARTCLSGSVRCGE